MSEPTIQSALCAVKTAVGAVGKTGENKQQGYRFRGVDAVVNAAAGPLNEHGVVITPEVLSRESETYQTKNGTTMRNVVVETAYTFTGPAGDSLRCVVLGEASDSGDKAVAKAQSVAYRVALLQVLNLPTDDPDPDESTHERGGRGQSAPAGPDWKALGWADQDEHDKAKASVREAAQALSDDAKAELKAWAAETGLPKKASSRDEMAEYRDKVKALASTYRDPADGEPVACLACGSTADPCDCPDESLSDPDADDAG